MKLKEIFFDDWHLKAMALLMGTTLWFVLKFGEKSPLSVERNIEIINQEKGYEYRLEKRRAKVRLRLMERVVSEEMIERLAPYVDVKGLREGDHLLRVGIKNVSRFLVSVEKVEPEYVRVRVLKAPEGGN